MQKTNFVLAALFALALVAASPTQAADFGKGLKSGVRYDVDVVIARGKTRTFLQEDQIKKAIVHGAASRLDAYLEARRDVRYPRDPHYRQEVDAHLLAYRMEYRLAQQTLKENKVQLKKAWANLKTAVRTAISRRNIDSTVDFAAIHTAEPDEN